ARAFHHQHGRGDSEARRPIVTHPAVRELFEQLSRHPAFAEIVRELSSGHSRPLSLSGLTTTAKALYMVLLWHHLERPLLLVTDGNQQAEMLAELTGTFFDLLSSGS